MSIGPSGIAGSAAGSQLPQAAGSDADQARKQSADQARRTEAGRQAESAEGVGQTREDQQSSDRDADGRRLWERDGDAAPPAAATDADADPADDRLPVKDPSGQRGTRLDLSG